MSELETLLSAERLAPARRPIERAGTLPAEAYTSREVYDREVERLFGREWLCAGRVDQLPEPGDYRCIDLLGHKLVIVRDSAGEVRVLSRVCRHRFAEVAKGQGRTRAFQCPYHAWTYRLDGTLAAAPMMTEMEFDRSQHRLPELRSEVWEGWIFVNFDADAAPLAPRLVALSELLAPWALGEMVATETGIYDSRFNWKLLVENFMESYHHIATHRDTLEPVFPARESWVLESEGPYSVLRMPSSAAGGLSGLPAIEGLESWQKNTLLALVVYPCHLFALSPDSMSWYQLLPQEVGRFELRIHTCFPPSTLDDPRLARSCQALRELTKTVHGEDIGACEAVWRGVNGAGTEPGRLHRLETAIWQQNQWWIERMIARE